MNKQEVKEFFNHLSGNLVVVEDGEKYIELGAILYMIDKIEPQKPVVPQVVIDYYEQYKDNFLSLSEWFEGLYGRDFLEDFPDGDKLLRWLHDNDYKTNRQRELALATLLVNGVEAVQVEQEKLYTVEIPDPHGLCKYRYLLKNSNGVTIGTIDNELWKSWSECQLTEGEIKKDFEWAWQAGFAKEVESNDIK